MFFYYVIFFYVIAMLFFSSKFPAYKIIFFCLTGLTLILIAGFRGDNVDNDYYAYISNFSDVSTPKNYFYDYQSNFMLEPAYYLIPSIVKYALNFNLKFVFVLFAAIGVTLKFKAILKLTDLAFLSVAVYVIHFYLLHEFTQIRTGIASGILLLCIDKIYQKKFVSFILLVALAACFHYMAIFILPLYYLDSKTMNKLFYFLLLVCSFVLSFFKLDLFSILSIVNLGLLTEKINFYQQLLSEGYFENINVFNVMLIVQVMLCCLFIYKAEYLESQNKYSIILIKVYTISQASFILLSSVPVFAFRISGLFEIVQIILVPFILYLLKPNYVAVSFIFIFCLVLLSINLLHSDLLKPYFK